MPSGLIHNTAEINYRDSVEIRERGLKALSNTLGTVGTVYFLRQFSNGSGNWTEERKTVLANVSEADFEKDLENLRKSPF
jgi:hypothetical protein